MTIRQGNKIIAGNINVEDYNTLQNKPQINSVELSGNKTLEELGIQTSGDYALKSEMELKADKANTLAGYGITDGLSTSQITNCITKIPQDIKVELKDGFIYVKAGSKIYFPDGKEEDGTNKFKEVILSNDIKSSQAGTDSNVLVLIDPELTVAKTVSPLANFSGETDPNTQTYSFWYDTANNIIKHMPSDLSGYISGFSFPVCVENQTDGTITSITQVFNGFGYIGSHWYELKGNEGEARNGRNVDGSLNNSTRTTTNVFVHVRGGGNGNWFLMSDFNGGFRNANKISYFIQDEMPSASSYSGNYAVWESPNENIIRITDNKGVTWTKTLFVNCGSYSIVDGRITSFNPKTVFHVVDSNNTTWASTQGKPSNKYVDLELKASGSSYTVPANGWVVLEKRCTSTNQNIGLGISGSVRFQQYSSTSGQTLSCSIPLSEKQSFYVVYTADGDTNIFRFIYDEGAK